MAEDEELVERAREGDAVAFEELVARYQARAVRLAYTFAGGDAEDAVQEAFVKAYRNLGRFRRGASFRPWLFAIVANEARNRRRSAGRRERLVVRAESGSAGASGSATPSPEDEVLAADRRRRLAAAIDTLGERDREVIACRWFAGLTEAETAVALACRPGTVKSRTSRALERLRAALPAEEVLR
jgi:RNA polymerase sigma-70 factor (ECF subfamily)